MNSRTYWPLLIPNKYIMFLIILFGMILSIAANSTTTVLLTTGLPATTTQSPAQICQAHNSSCEVCVKYPNCYWCNTNNHCEYYNSIIPRDCSLSKARWGVCWVNFQDLIIAMAVIGGILIITCSCCIYCCCCRTSKRSRKRYAEEDAKLEREKEERRIKNEEKRAERKIKNDEIRRKYGLMKEDNPYQRFDT